MAESRYAVLSDIHGNVPALDAVLAHVAPQHIDGLLIAGDLVGGPDADGVVERLAPYEDTTIAGNNEEYLLAFLAGDVTSAQHHVAQWAFARTCFRRARPETMQAIGRLPAHLVFAPQNTAPVRVVHGSSDSSSEALYPDRQPARLCEVLDDVEEAVFICGHTHESWQFLHNDCLALNPGSVGGACNGDARAQYAVLSWDGATWSVEHHAVSYDMALIQQIYVGGFLEEAGPMARAQLEGILTASHTMGDLVRHARGMATSVGHDDALCVPDDIWYEAVASFDWKLPSVM